MTERAPQDIEARRLAIDPKQSFLVQAPAGSGKTELLTDRILALLATVNKPEEIVAITFTRKAASEMHARVLSKLEKGRDLQAPQSSHERQSWQLARLALARSDALGWNLLTHPARLAIRTIDAFCSGLVRSMPWLANTGGMPRIANDPTAYYLAAARAVFEQAGDDADVRRLLEHLDLNVQNACEALASMLGQRDQWMPLLREGRDQGVLEDNLVCAIEQELAILQSLMPVAYGSQLAPSLRAAVCALEQVPEPHANLTHVKCLRDWDGTPFSATIDDLPRWQALEFFLFNREAKPVFRKSVTVTLGFTSKSKHKHDFLEWTAAHTSETPPDWAQALKFVESMPLPRFTDPQWEVLRAQIHCLRLAAAHLKAQFALSGEVDFIEIAQRADAALGRVDDPSDLLLRLDSSIRHLLIDEFQDTSQSQIELLKKLTDGWLQDDGRTLLLVGDPMQSIYRFRKAEVGLFLGVRDHGIENLQPTPLQLTDNFRSQSGIVHWVNHMFARIFPAQDNAQAGAIAYAPSVAYNGPDITPAVCQHWVFEHDPQTPQALLVTLVKEALFTYRESDHPVAILVRSRANLRGASELLARAQIPCRAVDLIPLNKRAYVMDIVQIVRALCHAGDRAAWLAVLRSPYCGMSLRSLHALFGRDKITAIPDLLLRALVHSGASADCLAQQCLDRTEYERLKPVAHTLLAALQSEVTEVFASKVQRVWQELDGPALARHSGDLQDAESVFRLIESMAPYGGLDLDEFETRLDKLYAAPETAGSSQDSAKGMVEIMTMHKSKGLQFDCVILFGLHEKPMSDKTPLVRIEQVDGRVTFAPAKSSAQEKQDPLANFLGEREKRRADYEVDRLLYVAATRARKRLHLVAQIKLNKDQTDFLAPPPTSLLARLWPHIEKPALPPRSMSDAPVVGKAPAFIGQTLERRRHPKVLSEANLVVSNSGVFNPAYVWAQDTAFEREIGVQVHAWLAYIGDQGLDAWSSERLTEYLPNIERQLLNLGVASSAVSAAGQEVLACLQAMVTHERGRWLLSHPMGKREWALLDETGKMSVLDLAVDEGDSWLVVDYKTGRPAPGEDAQIFGRRMLARYADQLKRYAKWLLALDGRQARLALYFPRDDLWVEITDPC